MVPCPVCARDTEVSVTETLRRCPSCDHVFQWPLEVTARYDYQYVHDRYEAYATTDLMSHLRLGFVSALRPGRGRLLDVGYGNGSFVKLADKAGFAAYGNDVHGCGDKFGIREMPLNGETWDIVTFFDSLEHFPDLSAPRAVCRAAGTVVVSVPCRPLNLEDIPAWKHYRPGEHLHYFSMRSLDRFMEGKRRLTSLDLEDVIRGPRGPGYQNILTVAYG